jgi:hypothetical protein
MCFQSCAMYVKAYALLKTLLRGNGQAYLGLCLSSSRWLLEGCLQGLQRLTHPLQGGLHAVHLTLHLLTMLLQALLSSLSGCPQARLVMLLPWHQSVCGVRQA